LTVFPSDPGSYVWSGSPNAYNSIYGAWYVYFIDGKDGNDYRDDSYGVRLVRDVQ
jgi:hypothetical protein